LHWEAIAEIDLSFGLIDKKPINKEEYSEIKPVLRLYMTHPSFWRNDIEPIWITDSRQKNEYGTIVCLIEGIGKIKINQSVKWINLGLLRIINLNYFL
jgi:hypothetical protein